ncbi:acetyl-CoA carboxylase, carboxyltransferase subunit beta [Weissella soli]|uniref:Acetyl-coenzyme A carboxylase carboxyl transferase subunit beta n=1 Tax=Weissella soli TaxID=155866 RepID=A0A288QW26_9LACO|nr:acetyl-CoA carboxylase, carboxyltransferase subunit beta [Weissella soli]AOT56011.1 Acetyl-CoA carboxylase [Weissella soli]NKY83909.1 acetyl-CoA carboxylase, carboxyltransferase subunit beta [Weissella soli]RDL01615.1 acetyl-CoA carboxylase carboxyl transferase subunit beta [Weissella soli]GEN93824.1 acetyl-coenzyme A carboxylase carboxyl transferase subunit beta [Weissella soli]GJM48607.1 acetyl-coenzyme A carboxylase carboxyl transferase subunit beta [Weissella soli]
MDLFNKDPKPAPTIMRDRSINDRIPDGLFLACPYCGAQSYSKQLGPFRVCQNCGYGFRLQAHERVDLLTDSFDETNADLKLGAVTFPGYQEKLDRARQQTDLQDSILTGIATIGEYRFALGVMDSYFIMGSLGTITGEKITLMFEQATRDRLPVVLFTASGGARMQEGINSLMQMAKVSAAVAEHSEAGLLFIVVLTDPTTGGVSASFANQGDITLAEPHALIGFAGKRVIEQTIHEKLPDDFQRAETVLEHGFIDAIIDRRALKETLAQLIGLHAQEVR